MLAKNLLTSQGLMQIILVMASVAVILVGKNEWQMEERGKDETD